MRKDINQSWCVIVTTAMSLQSLDYDDGTIPPFF